ncbi:MAG: GMC oxidoreductase [Actinomycetes bacterium]
MDSSQRPDVIVVGAGSAGCVLADRLSQTGRSVLVIEAGSDLRLGSAPSGISGPSFFAALGEPGRAWPLLEAQRVTGQVRRPYARGRGIGGSSAVNAMIGLWGEVEDYDAWERDFGCQGWSWRDVEPYFRRIEIPLTKADPGSTSRVGAALFETCRLEGWTWHRGPFPLGGIGRDVGPVMLTRSADGQRVTASDIYLERARERSHVRILCDTLVDRVAMQGTHAVGVILADGTLIESKETVICAGAIHSPAILLRSKIERPSIGQGLQDHASAPLTLALRESCPTDSVAATTVARLSSGFEPADLQILALDHFGEGANGFGQLAVALMYPRSRGQVTLSSQDPTIDPVVDFQMLSDEQDIEALKVGVNVARQLLASSALKDIATGVFIDDVGTPVEALDQSPDAIGGWLRASTGDYVHAAGTCAMGDPDSELSVVDCFGRVIGVTGLRVCDASIFPQVPRANTHFPAMMVAEVMADRW